MDAKSQRPKARDGALSSLNVAIEALNLAKEMSGITPVKAAFDSVTVLLTTVRVRFLPILRRWVSGSLVSRIRRLTNGNMSSSGWSALMSVEPLTGE